MEVVIRLVVALGANCPGSFGLPIQAMVKAINILESNGYRFVAVSSLYRTKPLGGGWQPDFLNAVVVLWSDHTPFRVLRQLKAIEREAGRRRRRRDGPRPLDLDIVDAGGRICGWPLRAATGKGRRPALALPHPLAHQRRFVLVPLVEVSPGWRHPVSGVPAQLLLARLPRAQGAVQRILDSSWISCDKRVEAVAVAGSVVAENPRVEAGGRGSAGNG